MMSNFHELLILSSSVRQIGKTHQICQAAKNMNATVICANKYQAKQLKEKYRINTKSMQEQVRGLHEIVFFDHFAIECLLQEAVCIEERNKILQEDNAELAAVVEAARRLYDNNPNIIMECDLEDYERLETALLQLDWGDNDSE